MKILIVGAGSIGSEIAHLFSNEYEITCIDHGRSFSILKKKLPKVRFVKGDINNEKLICTEAKDVDFIFYCINTGSVKSCIDSPVKYKKINEKDFKKFIKIVDSVSDGHFFLFSSCYVYPDMKNATEMVLPDPETNYGKLRLNQEEILKNSKLSHTILRLSNVFGYGHFFNVGTFGAIEKFIDCVFTNKKIMLYGDGSQNVDYLYKDDLMNLLKLLIKTKPQNTYNVASNKTYSIAEIAEIINNIAFVKYTKKAKVVKMNTNFKVPNSPTLSIHKIIKDMHWRPSTNIEKQIREIIHVYALEKNILKNNKMHHN